MRGGFAPRPEKLKKEKTKIAIFHATTKTVSRSAGRSSVAAAAYRSGEEITDERTGQVHDYTRRYGVLSTEIILPDGGSVERSALWNAAEFSERRKDGRTAREWIIALPSELNHAQRSALTHDFAFELAKRYGVAVDVAIHLPDLKGDNRNHHAHILTTTRLVTTGEDGSLVMGGKSTIELSDTKRRQMGLVSAANEITSVRLLWQNKANAALLRAGQSARIDARSLKAQGIDREPTAHMGSAATDMERRGVASSRGDDNRKVIASNARSEALVLSLFKYREAKLRKPEPRTSDPSLMTFDELETAIDGLRPKGTPGELAANVPEVAQVRRDVMALEAEVRQIVSAVDEIMQQQEDWRHSHPFRAAFNPKPLRNMEAREKQLRAKHRTKYQAMRQAQERLSHVQGSAARNIERQQAKDSEVSENLSWWRNKKISEAPHRFVDSPALLTDLAEPLTGSAKIRQSIREINSLDGRNPDIPGNEPRTQSFTAQKKNRNTFGFNPDVSRYTNAWKDNWTKRSKVEWELENDIPEPDNDDDSPDIA